jgi:hypothetical protein
MRVSSVSVLVVCAALGGCSSAANLLGGGSSAPAPQMASIPVGNQLALPPDLALAAPRNTVEGYQPNGAAPRVASTATTPRAEANLYGDSGATAGLQPGSLDYSLAKYGISKTKPDGTAKTGAEINTELRNAIIAEKRRANPNYGTIRNIGAIFSDG